MMDILTIITVITAIASFLSIFFKIPQIHISVRMFVLILSVICLIILRLIKNSGNKEKSKPNPNPKDSPTLTDIKKIILILLAIGIVILFISLLNKNNENDFQNRVIPVHSSDPNSNDKHEDNSSNNDLTSVHTDNQSLIDKNESDSSNNSELTDISSNIYEDANKESIDEFLGTDVTNNKEVLEIDPIIYSAYTVDTIEDLSFNIYPINIISFSGEISTVSQSNDYEYVPIVTGTYRFEFSNVPHGTYLRLRIFNSGWEQIAIDSGLDNGDGLTKSLTAGETYYIRVEQYKEFGSYTLNIGSKKEIADVTNYTVVSDSIQYTDQENDYMFVAGIDGAYRFNFSDVPNGTYLGLRIFNSGWEQIAIDSGLDNGDGLTKRLTAGETYYIRVKQYKNLGSYTLNIGLKKEIVNVTNYTAISDSIQYTEQENDYLFVAGFDGTYRFEFSDVPHGTYLRLRIFNSGWEQIAIDSGLNDGDGLTKSLTAGETYYIRVEQYKELGSYMLNIGSKKEIVDATNYASVSDSIQYTNQENDYLFIAKVDGTYRFEFSNVPNGTYLKLKLFNSGWEQMAIDSGLDNGDGLTKSLTAGEMYYIRVEQHKELGSYTLNVIPQK